MYERLKLVRKSLTQKTSQEKFGEILGVSRDAIKTYELGKVIPNDTFIQLLCAKFNVNETWLRTGEGEMYIQTDDTLFTKLSKEYNLSVGMQELLRAILDLDDERREQLVDFAVYFNSRLAPAIETSATNDIDKQVADYRRELEAEQKGQSVLQNLGEEKKA